MTTTTTPATPSTAAERVLKVPEAAERLACEDQSVYGLIRRGELRAVRVGRLIRIPESALADFLAGQTTGGPQGSER